MRLLNRKLDPPRADIEFHLTNDIRKHARTNCTSLERTVKFITFLEGKKREYGVETGKPLDVVVLGEVLGAALDEDTMGRLDMVASPSRIMRWSRTGLRTST